MVDQNPNNLRNRWKHLLGQLKRIARWAIWLTITALLVLWIVFYVLLPINASVADTEGNMAVIALIFLTFVVAVGFCVWKLTRYIRSTSIRESERYDAPLPKTEETSTEMGAWKSKLSWKSIPSIPSAVAILLLLVLAFALTQWVPWLQTVPRILIVFTIILIWMLCYARYRKTALGIIVAIAIVIFLTSGRGKIQGTTKAAPVPLSQKVDPTHTENMADDAFEEPYDIGKYWGEHPEVAGKPVVFKDDTVHPDAWSRVIILPPIKTTYNSDRANWCWQPYTTKDATPDWGISFLFLRWDNLPLSETPTYWWGEHPTFPVGTPLKFRLQGHVGHGIQFFVGYLNAAGQCVGA